MDNISPANTSIAINNYTTLVVINSNNSDLDRVEYNIPKSIIYKGKYLKSTLITKN
jgi:hypothetical protein